MSGSSITSMGTNFPKSPFLSKEKPVPGPEEIRKYFRQIFAVIGEDPTREGLLDTPDRIIRSWDELYRGYSQDPKDILARVFTESDGYDQIVILRNIPYFSQCEHHNLVFSGVAHIGYLAQNKLVGVSKMARLVDCFARRMQIQERMTKNIADSMMTYLKPLGVGVIVIGTHLCMTARGVQKPGASMVTSAMEGVFKSNEGGIKDEFLALLTL